MCQDLVEEERRACVARSGTAKNSDGRVVYMTQESKAPVAAQLARVGALGKELGRIEPPRLSSLGTRLRKG